MSTSVKGKLNENHPDAKLYNKEFYEILNAAVAEKDKIEQSFGGATKENYRAIAAACGAVQKQLGKDIVKLQEKYSYLFTE